MTTTYCRVLVTGSRAAMREADRVLCRTILDNFEVRVGQHLFVIQGGAQGYDRHAREWAEDHGRPCASVHAWWRRLRGAAGPIRNTWMMGLDPTYCLAFPGNAGTRDAIRKARQAGVTVRLIGDHGGNPDEDQAAV